MEHGFRVKSATSGLAIRKRPSRGEGRLIWLAVLLKQRLALFGLSVVVALLAALAYLWQPASARGNTTSRFQRLPSEPPGGSYIFGTFKTASGPCSSLTMRGI